MSEFGAAADIAAQVLAEIAEIDRRIASLIELRDGLSRVFVNASRVEAGDIVGIQMAESRCAMIEHVILEMLGKAEDFCLRTKDLFESARAVSTHLKYVTFRSYLHRLKLRGLITAENVEHGSWKLVKSTMGGPHDRALPLPQ
jgi:hypothetical protein